MSLPGTSRGHQRTHPHVLVIGAGVLGASVAYHLGRMGARVTVLEAADRPGQGVSAHSFGWINRVASASSVEDPIFQIREAGLADWPRFISEFPAELPYQHCGALLWRGDAVETEQQAEHFRQLGLPATLVGPDKIAALEPHLAEVPPCAIHAPEEAVVDPVGFVEVLLAASGAEVRAGLRVDFLDTSDERIVGAMTPKGLIKADAVVLACGMGAGPLARTVGVHLPLKIAPAVMITLSAVRQLANGIIVSPDIEMRQAAPGRLLAAESAGDPKVLATQAVGVIEKLFKDPGEIRIASAVVGERPDTENGQLIAVRLEEGLYAAVGHPGFIMAPKVGRVIAEAILEERGVMPLAG